MTMEEQAPGPPAGGPPAGPDDPASMGSASMTATLSGLAAPPSARAEPAGALTGRRLAQFELQGLLGSGGFGEVYRARDTRLGRTVAVKALRDGIAFDAAARERFRREAVAASGLNHPSICTVHDLVDADGRALIVMELIEGETLQERVRRGPLPLPQAVAVARQVAEALGEAHRAGILHRDVKCRNIALDRRGHVKVLDFGLAKLFEKESTESGPGWESLTETGGSAGTPGYMSPEQILGRPVDARSDLFSLGIVLFRMVTGRLPFEGTSKAALAAAVLHQEPKLPSSLPLPAGLRELIGRLLEKQPDRRPASADEVVARLRELEDELAPGRGAGSRTLRHVLVVAAFAVVVAGGWLWVRWSRERWARAQVPAIEKLVEAEEFSRAAGLLREARSVLPDDRALGKLWNQATGEFSVTTTPPEATLAIRPYGGTADSWETIGTTPIASARAPLGFYLFRFSRPGFAPLTLVDQPRGKGQYRLQPEASVPAGMVAVEGFTVMLGYPFQEAPTVKLPDFAIGRTEVTNEEYQRFVAAGGYRDPRFWTEPFVKEGRTLSFEEAMALFRDTTGLPGPSTWEEGTFPKGQGRHPVAGLGWFEASAYARFAGHALPSAYHWTAASELDLAAPIVKGSNFRPAGTQPVGEPGTDSGYGTVDMAGNVKEWVTNEGRAGMRLVLGGGFGEAAYMFPHADEASPWERRGNFGLRCVHAPAAPAEASARVTPTTRDFWKETPVPDEVFAAYRGLYAYDDTPLDGRVEETEVTGEWRREKVSFAAAYGGERVAAHLFLPRGTPPPYQPVVFFPGAYAYFLKKFEASMLRLDFGYDFGFVTRSGRALVVPIYRGQYERADGIGIGGKPVGLWRDRVVAQSKDLGRCLDYLATRTDLDAARAAYLGHSAGGAMAPLLLGIEHRFKAAVLLAGGFWFRHPLPEVEALNFAPRVTTPVLMVNGRWDSAFPLETSQRPLFARLGTPEKDRRHVVVDDGHFPPQKLVVRETLAWLDRYLGPVAPRGAAGP